MAATFNCDCKVQSSGGDEQTARATVQGVNSEAEAISASKEVCFNKAKSKFQFTSNWTEFYPVTHRCSKGAVVSVE